MKTNAHADEFLLRLHGRIAQHMEREQLLRTAPPEVLRRVVDGKLVICRSVRR